MSMTFFPNPVVAPLQKRMTVYAQLSDATSVTLIRWTILPATKGRFYPTESQVERRTFVVDGPEGPKQTTGYYAVTELQMLELGTATITAEGLGAAPDSETLPAVAMNMEIDNEAIFTRAIAHNPPFSEPVVPGSEDQTVELAFRIHGDVEGIDEPVANHPVYFRFDPPVVTLYGLGPDGTTWQPAGLPTDPYGKGLVTRTDENGRIRLRGGSREQVLGKMFAVAAGDNYESTFAIATFSRTDGVYPAPEGVSTAVNLSKMTSSIFYERIPVSAPVDDAGYVMMWMQGKDGVEHYGAVTTPGDLKLNGQPFAFSDVVTDGTRTNSVAYLVQKGANAAQSVFQRFSAVGQVPSGPDPTIANRPLAMPTINTQIVNVYFAKHGITLTVPRFTAADLEPADAYILQVSIYFTGWDHETGLPRKPATLLLDPKSYTTADLPAADVDFLLAYFDLSGWDKSPAPENQSGTFRAEYTVTAISGAPPNTKRSVFYSKVLGADPKIPLDTPPDPLGSISGGEKMAGEVIPSAARKIQGTPIPEDTEEE
ncbi:MAG: hypothetical protein ACN6O8_06090 [Achromobacter sp.]|uniref:hypothetical protein n=1 Tax=Achromobacter sp. TaxID=134375 RepID=UPI003D01DD4D